MIKHVVFWKVKDFSGGNSKDVIVLKIKQRLESMQGKINGLVSIQAGINKNKSADAYDVCLISEHPSWEDLAFYQEHPLHKEVAAFIGEIRESRSVVDFEY